MGRSMTQRYADFEVKPQNVAPMLHALRKLTGTFQWVPEGWQRKVTAEGIFRAWSWDIERDDSGRIVGIAFRGEKYRETVDRVLFETIAPYVTDGCYIEMQGEEGDVWRWSFEDGTCRELEGVLDFTPIDYHAKYIDLRARAQEALDMIKRGEADNALRALVIALE